MASDKCNTVELEDLQRELLDLTTKTKAQAREIVKLKSTIKGRDARNEDSKDDKLRIQQLEKEINELAGGRFDVDALNKLRDENDQLRESIQQLRSERRKLKKRLESVTNTDDKSGPTGSKSSQVLRERNQALKFEVDKLTKRLQKMESSITRFAI